METNMQTKEIREKIIEGLKKAYINLLEMKRNNNGVLVFYKNGHIVKIKPDKKKSD